MTTFTIGKSDVPFDDVEDLEPEPASNGHAVPNHVASEPENEPGPVKRAFTFGKRPPRKPREPKLKDAAPRMPAGGLAAPLTDMYIMVGAVISPMDATCGGAIINQAPECAKALEKLAKTNPEVRRVLVNLISGSAYGAVITAHIPIVMAVAMHHMPGVRPEPAPVEDLPTDDEWQQGDPMPRAS